MKTNQNTCFFPHGSPTAILLTVFLQCGMCVVTNDHGTWKGSLLLESQYCIRAVEYCLDLYCMLLPEAKDTA